MSNSNTFPLRQVDDNVYNLLCKEIGLTEMNKDSRDWLVFKYNKNKKKLCCYKWYIKEQYLIKEIEVELMQYLPPLPRWVMSIHASRACERKVDMRWGLKEDVIKFRKELAAKLLEGI